MVKSSAICLWESMQSSQTTKSFLTRKDLITKKLFEFAGKADLIVTTGGTGVGPRDVTPEATGSYRKRIAGFAEAVRMEGLKHTPRSMGSRAVAGIYKQTLIINLPGSPRALLKTWQLFFLSYHTPSVLLRAKVSDCAKDREKHVG